MFTSAQLRFSPQYCIILTPPPPAFPTYIEDSSPFSSLCLPPTLTASNQGHGEAEQNRKTGISHWKRRSRVSQKPQILRRPQNSQTSTVLTAQAPPYSHKDRLTPSPQPTPLSSTLHSPWTGQFSAAGRLPCTCWQPLCISSV